MRPQSSERKVLPSSTSIAYVVGQKETHTIEVGWRPHCHDLLCSGGLARYLVGGHSLDSGLRRNHFMHRLPELRRWPPIRPDIIGLGGVLSLQSL